MRIPATKKKKKKSIKPSYSKTQKVSSHVSTAGPHSLILQEADWQVSYLGYRSRNKMMAILGLLSQGSFICLKRMLLNSKKHV